MMPFWELLLRLTIPLSLLLVVFLPHGCAYANSEEGNDHRQGDFGREAVTEILCDHFPSDEGENHGYGGFEVLEVVHGGAEDRVQAPKAQNGEHVRRKNDKWVLRKNDSCVTGAIEKERTFPAGLFNSPTGGTQAHMH